MKLQLGLVSGFFIRALSLPFMLGAAKYERGDWANQPDPKKFIEDRLDSLLRHLTLYMDGQHFDKEGPHHLAAVAWNALAILYYLVRSGVVGEVAEFSVFERTVESYRALKEKNNVANTVG